MTRSGYVASSLGNRISSLRRIASGSWPGVYLISALANACCLSILLLSSFSRAAFSRSSFSCSLCCCRSRMALSLRLASSCCCWILSAWRFSLSCCRSIAKRCFSSSRCWRSAFRRSLASSASFFFLCRSSSSALRWASAWARLSSSSSSVNTGFVSSKSASHNWYSVIIWRPNPSRWTSCAYSKVFWLYSPRNSRSTT